MGHKSGRLSLRHFVDSTIETKIFFLIGKVSEKTKLVCLVGTRKRQGEEE